MPDVFVSYAREDCAVAQKLHQDLRKKGIDAWLDSENLLGGSTWEVEIPRTIRESRFVVVLLSKASVSKRGYVQKEVKVAVEQLDRLPEAEIHVIPVRLEQCEPSHSRLAALHWIDLYPSYLSGLNKILTTLVQDSEVRKKIESAADRQRKVWPAIELKHQVGEASGESEWVASEKGFLAFGPYISLWTGRYTAAFHLAIEEFSAAGSSTQVAHVDVTSKTANRTIETKNLKHSDFPGLGDYQVFQVEFEIEGQEDNVEFRVFNTGAVQVKLEKIELYESGKAA